MVAATNAQPEHDGVHLPVLRRADTTTSGSDYKPTAGVGESMNGEVDADLPEEEPEEEPEEDPKKDTKSETGTGKNTKTASGDDDEPTKTSSSSKTTSTKVRVGVHDRHGGINMIEPDIFQAPFIYKLGDVITFKWNMTSVKATPTAINVEAYNDANKHYYTIAGNISAKETSVEWDTEKDLDAEFPLMEARYTLNIYDAAAATKTEQAKAGGLNPFRNLQFGLYKPKAPVKNEDFKCIGCSSASGLRVAMGTTILATASAMYFVFSRAL